MINFKDRLTDGLEKMLKYRESAGYSEGKEFRYFIPHFINYCCSVSSNSEYITREMFESFLATCPKTNGTLVKISNIRQYTKFLCFLGGKDYIPTDDYNYKLTKFEPFLFTDLELHNLFMVLDTAKSYGASVRFKPELVLPVYSRLLYCCGLRPSEVPCLKVEDFNMNSGELYIRKSKQNKDRHIVLSDDMLSLCSCYNSLAGNRTWFFQRFDGEPYRAKWFYHHFEKTL